MLGPTELSTSNAGVLIRNDSTTRFWIFDLAFRIRNTRGVTDDGMPRGNREDEFPLYVLHADVLLSTLLTPSLASWDALRLKRFLDKSESRTF